MASVLKKLLLTSRFAAPVFKKNLHVASRCFDEYSTEGKTTITVLNKNFDYGLMIDTVNQDGFILNNGIRTLGPMILFPKTMISWNIATSADMTEESLSLLLHMDPKIDIVVIGLDDDYPYHAPFLQNIREIFKDHKIPMEMLPIHQACSTFNFLNAENRYAAGAFIPPKVKYVEDILLGEKEKSKQLNRDTSEIPLLSPEEVQNKWEVHAQKSAISMDLSNDPLNSNYNYNDEPEKKKKEILESFKVRSPWRDELKPEKDFSVVGKKKADEKDEKKS